MTASCELSGPAGAPVIAVLGGISAPPRVEQWWAGVAGPGLSLDTGCYRLLGFEFLDGGRAGNGRPARVVTTHDQARGLAVALDALGIARLHALVGASYGGMVALAFAETFADRVARLVVISAAHQTHPMSTALRALQRRIVELGLDAGCAERALAIARGLAMTTYRTAEEFAGRFGIEPRHGEGSVSFEAERYLASRGARFAATFPPERFLALSLSADLHRVTPERIRVPATIVAAEGDRLVPEAQLRELAARLAAPAGYARLTGRTGHDAFLTEQDQIARILHGVLGRVSREVA